MTKQVKSKERVSEHGEVFTNEREVNAMLDLVKQETERIDSRFLEPACGEGAFLKEILRRKLETVRNKYRKSPHDYGRCSILALTSIYGVDILEDNARICRQSLFDIWNAGYTQYAKRQANDKCRETAKFILEKNILCADVLAMLQNDGTPVMFAEWSPVTGDSMKRREYRLNEFFGMTFDVIIGNPPYQMNDGGSGTGISAKPLYHHFVEQAKKLNPAYLVMIIPSRWFAGGKGLDEFRDHMLNDKHISHIVDYMSSKDCFPGVSIAGGVNYFLWDRSYSGDCIIENRSADEAPVAAVRPLNEFDIFIRDNRAVNIIRKFLHSGDANLADNTFTRNPFGFVSRERGAARSFGDKTIQLVSSAGAGYVSRGEIAKNQEYIDKYKVTIGKIVPGNGEVDTDPKAGYKVTTSCRILGPNVIHTESYLCLHCFDTQEEAENFAGYMALKFPRFMMKQTLSSMNISKQNFVFVPYLDYSKPWTDEELFDRYGLSEDERGFVTSIIRDLPLNGKG